MSLFINQAIGRFKYCTIKAQVVHHNVEHRFTKDIISSLVGTWYQVSQGHFLATNVFVVSHRRLLFILELQSRGDEVLDINVLEL